MRGLRVAWGRACNLITYRRRRRDNWRDGCGCEFRATAYGWLHIKCIEHWLD